MRRTLLLVVVSLLFTIAGPARAQFCPGVSPWVFDDVQASDPFCGYITWMAQNGITLGCQVIDANHRLYCPGANVSRAAMAAFMNRLGNVRVEAVDTGPGLTGGPITGIGTINLAATQLLPTTACSNNQIARWNGSAWTCSTDTNSGGTVTSVATGAGLTGGPITTTGTVGLAATQLLPTVACSAGQVPQWSGGAWACAAAGGAGTVTSVGSGTGLSGGPITTSGALSIAASYQLPQSCTNGQIPKSNGAGGWTCAADAAGTGTVTSVTAGAGLTGGTITTSGTISVDPASSVLIGNFLKQGGNAFGTAAVIGTTDNNALDVQVNGARAMRYEPNAISPNVIGGSLANRVSAEVRGATIAGGGVPFGDTDPDFPSEAPNRVTDHYGTIGGGYANLAGDGLGTVTDAAFATVGGGQGNYARGGATTIGGGAFNNAAAYGATVGGGRSNTASSSYAFVGGGFGNTASYDTAFVGGGYSNSADGTSSSVSGGYFNHAGSGATVGGGFSNTAVGFYATIPGGHQNEAAGAWGFAAGRRAKAMAQGCFVWADSVDADFACNVANGFFVRPSGGVRIEGPGNWDVANTEGDTRIGNDIYRLKFGIALAGGGAGDAWVRAHGGIERFNIWAPGGTRVLTNAAGTTGVSIAAGSGTWSTLSDRSAKRDLTQVDGADALERLVAMPVYRWRYIEERSGASHMGPTAQDFRAAFGLGENDTTIATVDADGVALAAIQGLNAKLEAKIAERDERIAAQAREIAELKAAHTLEIAELKRALEALLARTSPEGRVASR